MKVVSVMVTSSAMLDTEATLRGEGLPESARLVPTPSALVKGISRCLALSNNHGCVGRIQVAAIHNGEPVARRLSCAVPAPADNSRDLNEFTDGVAAPSPLAKDGNAITVGSAGKPINARYWKAGKQELDFVVAKGFGASGRRSAGTSGLATTSKCADGRWTVDFRHLLSRNPGSVSFVLDETSRIAFALWSGSNGERSGRISFSGDVMPSEIVGAQQ